MLLYFQHIHDRHHSLFHQPSVEVELEKGQVPDVLLFSMMALGARFSDSTSLSHVKPRYRGTEFVKRAIELLDMTDISITTIQACVLLGTISYSESKMETEALYYAVANRLAFILDLSHRPVADCVERQVNLRSKHVVLICPCLTSIVYWTLYMIDIWNSTGLQLPRQMYRSDHIPLPIEESVFLQLSKDSDNLDLARSSIWAEMVHLAHIWAEIHDLNKAIVGGSMQPEYLSRTVDGLSNQLNNWSTSLQPHLKATKENLEKYASIGLGSALAALHLGFHYYNVVLFYQFLAEDAHDSSISAISYSENCEAHATHFCNLLDTCNSIPGCECLYIMVGHMLVVTSTVYIHTLLFNSVEEQIRKARRRLEQNFQILTQLQSYWIKLDDTLSRLKAFHDACMTSIETSFFMDRWMLSFILEHGTQVHERFRRSNSPATSHSIATSESASPDLTLQDWYSQTFSSEKV